MDHLCCAFFQVLLSFFAGFAFVYFEDERDAEDAIRHLDDTPFGPGRRRLSVEWSKVISAFVFSLIRMTHIY